MAPIVPVFKIEEMSGARRVLTLRGRALPFRPLSLEGEQRVEVEYPAGHPEGTAQVSGPTEGECTIKGFWKDKFLDRANENAPLTLGRSSRGGSGGDALHTVVDAYQTVDSFRVQGQRVRVSWGPIIRFGFIKKFLHEWHNVHDMEWSLTFVWTSRAESTFSALPVADGLGSAASAFRSLLNAVLNAVRGVLALIDDFMDLVNSFLDIVSALANELDDLANAILDTALSPLATLDKLDRALVRITNIGGTLQERFESAAPSTVFQGLQTRFERTSTAAREAAAADAERAAIIDADRLEMAAESALATQMLQAQTIQQNVIRAARALRNEAVLRERMSAARPGDIAAQHTVREGEDLRDVSSLYYGTPYHWQALMLYNGLEHSSLEVGQTVLVPRQTGSDAGEG